MNGFEPAAPDVSQFQPHGQSPVSACRSSSSCATASCWTSGSCRPTSPTSWRAPWSTTPATVHKCGASSATCSCTSGKNVRPLCCWERCEKEKKQWPFPSLSALCSLEQLGFNALLQLMIGVPLEMVHGILRISLLYMAGVLAGEEPLKCTCYTANSDEFLLRNLKKVKGKKIGSQMRLFEWQTQPYIYTSAH